MLQDVDLVFINSLVDYNREGGDNWYNTRFLEKLKRSNNNFVKMRRMGVLITENNMLLIPNTASKNTNNSKNRNIESLDFTNVRSNIKVTAYVNGEGFYHMYNMTFTKRNFISSNYQLNVKGIIILTEDIDKKNTWIPTMIFAFDKDSSMDASKQLFKSRFEFIFYQ